MRYESRKSVAGKINPLMMIALIAVGLGVAYWYLTNKKAADKSLNQAGKALEQAAEQASKDVDKSAAETAAELEARNANIQAKRGFNITK